MIHPALSSEAMILKNSPFKRADDHEVQVEARCRITSDLPALAIISFMLDTDDVGSTIRCDVIGMLIGEKDVSSNNLWEGDSIPILEAQLLPDQRFRIESGACVWFLDEDLIDRFISTQPPII